MASESGPSVQHLFITVFLLQKLEQTIGIKGISLQWFESDRLQFVHVNRDHSHTKGNDEVPMLGQILSTFMLPICKVTGKN